MRMKYGGPGPSRPKPAAPKRLLETVARIFVWASTAEVDLQAFTHMDHATEYQNRKGGVVHGQVSLLGKLRDPECDDCREAGLWRQLHERLAKAEERNKQLETKLALIQRHLENASIVPSAFLASALKRIIEDSDER